MRLITRLGHILILIQKWLPVIIELINYEDRKDDPAQPDTENDFQHRAVGLILPQLGMSAYEDVVNVLIDRAEGILDRG